MFLFHTLISYATVLLYPHHTFDIQGNFFNFCLLQFRLVADTAMDDDDDGGSDAGPSASGSACFRRKQGVYKTPEAGIFWVWQRHENRNSYSKLMVRDASAGIDLCVVTFQGINSATTHTRGRRSNTVLPMEDRMLLKEEFSTGIVRLTVESGSILETSCLPSNCSLHDLELALGMSTPWDSENKHRIEIPSSRSNRIGEKKRKAPGPVAEPQQQGHGSKIGRGQSNPLALVQYAPGSDGQEQQQLSLVDHALKCISAAVGPMNDPQLWNHISNLSNWLQVSCL